MKNILLIVVFFLGCQNLIGQYQKAYNKAKQYEKQENYYDAILSYSAAEISKDAPKKNDANDRIDYCTKKLQEQKNELNKTLNQKKIETNKANSLLLVADTALKKVKQLADENLFQLYIFNAKNFANKSLNLKINDTLKTQLALKAFQLSKFGYSKFKPDEIQVFDNEILQALNSSFHDFETYQIDDYKYYSGNIGSGISTSLSYKNNLFLAFTNNKFRHIQLSDPTSSNWIDVFNKNIENEYISSMDIIPSDSSIFTGTFNGKIYKYNYISKSFYQIIQTKNFAISKVLINKPLNKFIILDNHNIIHLLNFDNGIEIKKIADFASQNILLINNYLLAANFHGELFKLDLENPEEPPISIYKTSQGYFNIMRAFPELNIFVCSVDNKIILFKSNELSGTFQSSVTLPVKHSGYITDILISSDLKKLISADFSGEIMIWPFPDQVENLFDNVKIKTIEPVIFNTKLNILTIHTSISSNYLFFLDMNDLFRTPIDINLIYLHLLLVLKNKSLSPENWEYYKKGTIDNPDKL